MTGGDQQQCERRDQTLTFRSGDVIYWLTILKIDYMEVVLGQTKSSSLIVGHGLFSVN